MRPEKRKKIRRETKKAKRRINGLERSRISKTTLGKVSKTPFKIWNKASPISRTNGKRRRANTKRRPSIKRVTRNVRRSKKRVTPNVKRNKRRVTPNIWPRCTHIGRAAFRRRSRDFFFLASRWRNLRCSWLCAPSFPPY